ncbi:hypothetical protein N0V88_008052 [Collariella sp. IMI 366227]|nr:hypothetical protein N0V88_008052 [Collariella sp. IMI 366227]
MSDSGFSDQHCSGSQQLPPNHPRDAEPRYSKDGKYIVLNDQQEQTRLDLQHTILKTLLKGKLNLAPVSNTAHVLDLGTGTGIWAIEFAEQNPLSSVLGTDLSEIQALSFPPNCRFKIADADEWAYTRPFDYIHSRSMLYHLKTDWRVYFGRAYANLAPGGWAEFKESDLHFQGIDDATEGTVLQRWNGLLIKSYMEEAGFVGVEEKKFAVPMSPWPEDEEQKALGVIQLENMLAGIEVLTMSVFVRMLGWEAKDVEQLVKEVKKDLTDPKCWNIYARVQSGQDDATGGVYYRGSSHVA